MRVLVCGGRDFTNSEALTRALDHLASQVQITHVIHGDARGADTLAKQWAVARGIPQTPYPADWNVHGKGAGPIRNREMLREGKPDYVVAFPGGSGTDDMVCTAEAARVPVWDLREVLR